MRSLRSLVSSLAFCSFTVSLAACSSEEERFRSEHSPLVVSETSLCRVTLTKVSYDDPSTDDAEFLELRVDRSASTEGTTTGTSGAADSGAPSTCGTGGGASTGDAGDTHARGGLALDECGLSTIELLNGSSDACVTYRTLSIGATAVPADDVVVICSPDSLVAGSAGCDVTTAGTSKLPNGWLQNGPGDGMRFSGSAGTTAEITYAGINSTCFQGTPVTLVQETGQAADGGDDVNIACGSEFHLVSSTSLTPRGDVSCEPTTDASSDPASGGTQTGSIAPVSISSGGAGFGSTTQMVDRTESNVLSDAAATDAAAMGLTPEQPSAPGGCHLAREKSTTRCAALFWGLGLGLAFVGARRRRRSR